MARGAVFLAVWCITVSFFANYTYGILNHLLMSECMTEAQEWGRIENLTIVPWPPVLPGNITVAATIHLSRAVTGNIKASLEIRRKLGFLGYAIRIPCFNKSVPIGSCNYTNLCGMLDQRLGDHHATSAEIRVSDLFTSITTTTTTEEITTTTGTYTSTTALPPTTTTDNNMYSMTVTAPTTTSTQTPTVITTSKGPTTHMHSHHTTRDHTATQEVIPEIVGRALAGASMPGWEATDQWTTEVITSGATIQAAGHLTSDVTAAGHITPGDVTPTDSYTIASDATPTESHLTTNEDTPTAGPLTSSEVTPTKDRLITNEDTPTAGPLTSSEVTPTEGRLITNEDTPTAGPLTSSDVTPVTKIEPTPELVQEVTTTDAGSGGDESCPAILADNGIPCNCPFHAGTYVIPHTDFVLPDIGSFAALAKGDYQVKVRFYDDSTGELVMCQTLEVSIGEAPATHPPPTTHAPIVG